MEKITWEQLLESDIQTITLIGYGSLLNTQTHHADHAIHPVIFYGFQRKYNLPCVPKVITKQWESFARGYLKRYSINCEDSFQEYIQKNYHVLNCEYTGNPSHSVNGLAVEIHRDEFYNYALREEKYELYKTPYFDFNPDNAQIGNKSKTGYVLVAKADEVSYTGNIFPQYHETTRNGAYNIGLKFGEYFDATTQK